LLDSVEDVVETYTEEFTGAQVGEDVSDTARAATVAAGNNAIFAMGGVGAGKFKRQLAMNRVKNRIRIEMHQHEQDSRELDQRLGLQHTLSSSLYAGKINAKRQSAGLHDTTGLFSAHSKRSVLSAREVQMQRMNESEHTQGVARMIQSARHEGQTVDRELARKAEKSRRRYAGRVASKRRNRNLSIGGFARSAGVHVDPLVDIMAVSKFMHLRQRSCPILEVDDDILVPSEVRNAKENMWAFGDVPSARHVKLPAAILAAVSGSNTDASHGSVAPVANPSAPCAVDLVPPALASTQSELVDRFLEEEHGARDDEDEAQDDGKDSSTQSELVDRFLEEEHGARDDEDEAQDDGKDSRELG
jgi:hypothetical protein